MNRIWVTPGFFGVRLHTWYFKVRDTRRHPLLFSERNRIRYRRLLRVGHWEVGVKS